MTGSVFVPKLITALCYIIVVANNNTLTQICNTLCGRIKGQCRAIYLIYLILPCYQGNIIILPSPQDITMILPRKVLFNLNIVKAFVKGTVYLYSRIKLLIVDFNYCKGFKTYHQTMSQNNVLSKIITLNCQNAKNVININIFNKGFCTNPLFFNRFLS